jgi:hypothetical protein
MSVYDEIRSERVAQDAQWGGAQHDGDHDDLEWLELILRHAGKMLSGALRTERHSTGHAFHDRPHKFTVHVPAADERNLRAYRKQLVRVAALAVAAIEAHDRRVSKKQEG